MPGKGRVGRKRVDSSGYVKVCIDSNNKERAEHRIVLESKLGRKLLPTEVVHHINGDKSDNRPENLDLFASQSEHMSHHMTSERARQAQQKSAESKHKKTIEKTLPNVILGIRLIIDSGESPTQRACRKVPGYSSIQRYFPQAELVKRAKELNKCEPWLSLNRGPL